MPAVGYTPGRTVSGTRPPVGIIGAGQFDPNGSVYNLTQNLHRTRAKLGQAYAGAGQLDILCAGPSTTEGFTTSISTQSYEAYLKQRLTARGYTAATGWVFCQYNTAASTDDSRWVFTNYTKYTAFKTMLVVTSAGSSTAVFTSTDPGTIIEFQIMATYPAFSYSVDGGTATNVSAGGVANGHTTFTAGTGLANTTHTLTITCSSANLFILAARVRPATGVLVSNCGYGGSKTSDWDTTQTGGQVYTISKTSTMGSVPDLVILDAYMFINDFDNSITLASSQAALARIVGQYQAQGCEVMLLLPNPPSATVQFLSFALFTDTLFQQYRQAAYAVADSTGVPLLDMADRNGLWAVTNANGLMTDAYHATPSGNASVAEALEAMLLR